MTRHYVAESPREMAIILLRRLATPKLAANLLKGRAARAHVQIDPELVERKARGVASAIDSALGYLRTDAENLNQALVARYYAMLHLTIAEQVADVTTPQDLASVQQHTMWGHGLAAVDVANDQRFPQSFGVAFTARGYFKEYMKYVGVTVPQLSRKVDEPMTLEHAEIGRVELLGDLLRTIPELQNVVYEHVGSPPRALHIGYSHLGNPDREFPQIDLGPLGLKRSKPSPPKDERVFIDIYSAPGVTLEYLRGLDLAPLQDVEEVPPDRWSERSHFRASFQHVVKEPGDWWDNGALPNYRSNFAGVTFVSPTATGLRDPYLINILALYGLSIVARYRPDLWSEITYGSLTDVKSLLEYYLATFDMIAPIEALSRIIGERVIVSLPGTMNSPV